MVTRTAHSRATPQAHLHFRPSPSAPVSHLAPLRVVAVVRSNYCARHRSIVTDLFAGQLRSEVRCLQCRTRRVAFDPILDLSLPLPPHAQVAAADRVVPLADCFTAFIASEQLAGDDMNAVYCPHCKRHTSCTKVLSLYRLPAVLVVQIKRFSFDSRAGRIRRKLHTRVAAPLHLTINSAGGPQLHTTPHSYSLIAAINHVGNAHSGHYIAHAHLGQPPQQWYHTHHTDSGSSAQHRTPLLSSPLSAVRL